MKQKIIEIIKIIFEVFFIIGTGLYAWCACVLNSRYEEDDNTNNDNNNDNNVH